MQKPQQKRTFQNPHFPRLGLFGPQNRLSELILTPRTSFRPLIGTTLGVYLSLFRSYLVIIWSLFGHISFLFLHVLVDIGRYWNLLEGEPKLH